LFHAGSLGERETTYFGDRVHRRAERILLGAATRKVRGHALVRAAPKQQGTGPRVLFGQERGRLLVEVAGRPAGVLKIAIAIVVVRSGRLHHSVK
jgi:hypothetical protein